MSPCRLASARRPKQSSRQSPSHRASHHACLYLPLRAWPSRAASYDPSHITPRYSDSVTPRFGGFLRSISSMARCPPTTGSQRVLSRPPPAAIERCRRHICRIVCTPSSPAAYCLLVLVLTARSRTFVPHSARTQCSGGPNGTQKLNEYRSPVSCCELCA